MGKVDAQVVIVEFLDPACETCREFYPMVKQMMAASPDKIRIVLRYAPFHAGSDKVVAMLEAARRQGKFWQRSKPCWKISPIDAASRSQRGECMETHRGHRSEHGADGLRYDLPEIASVIAQDLADAKTLNVTMTPEFFVNGKPLPSFGFEQLKALVDQALADSRAR